MFADNFDLWCEWLVGISSSYIITLLWMFDILIPNKRAKLIPDLWKEVLLIALKHSYQTMKTRLKCHVLGSWREKQIFGNQTCFHHLNRGRINKTESTWPNFVNMTKKLTTTNLNNRIWPKKYYILWQRQTLTCEYDQNIIL